MNQTPYEQGVRANTDGLTIRSNPYVFGNREWHDWQMGWFAANKGDDCDNKTRGDEDA